MPSSCNDEVFLRIPNLKKLGVLVVGDSDTIRKCYSLDNLVHSTHLEKLKVQFKENLLRYILKRPDWKEPISPRLCIPHCDSFPPNLKKLTLFGTYLQWEDMNILKKLPNLEVLKLKHHAFHGLIWKLSDEDEDGFFQLKFLLFESLHLKQWEATSYHFPSLEHLVLTDCRYLEQIPFDFAEIQTLQLIELHKCKRSVLISAEQIQEEQQSLGNDDLVIRVNYILRNLRLHIPHCDNFPPNLKKLTLCRTNLQWEDMNILRKLPNLEVLKLKHHAFNGLIWKLSDEEEDGFFQLKFLLLEHMHLKQWEATSYHFPCLEHLVLTDCRYLEQIPFDFAEIQTLQLIELHNCVHSVLVSAEQLQEEQQSFGNDDLIIRVNCILEKTLLKTMSLLDDEEYREVYIQKQICRSS